MKYPRIAPRLALILLFLAGGCAHNPQPDRTSFGDDPQDRSIRIFVTNLNFMDATIWAVTPGTREKLGVVTGKLEAVYTLPWGNFREIRIEIDLLAGPRCTTEAIPVDPGDHIQLIIDLEMTRSDLCRGFSAP